MRDCCNAMWPATFPSGEGSDLAGVVTKVGPGVANFVAGDEVIGFTDQRASHAEYVVVKAPNLTIKPAKVPWEVAGSLAIAGSTAYASVRAVSLTRGDTVAVSAAAGGVGVDRRAARDSGGHQSDRHRESRQSRMARSPRGETRSVRRGARRPTARGENRCVHRYARRRVRQAGGRSWCFPATGSTPSPILPHAREYGAKAEGSSAALNASVLAELAALVASGDLEVPIAATFPLSDVRAAFSLLAKGHIRGKIVLLPLVIVISSQPLRGFSRA